MAENLSPSFLSATSADEMIRSLANEPGREGKTSLSVKKGERKRSLSYPVPDFSETVEETAKNVGQTGGSMSQSSPIGVMKKSPKMELSGQEAAAMVFVLSELATTGQVASAMAVRCGAITLSGEQVAALTEAYTTTLFNRVKPLCPDVEDNSVRAACKVIVPDVLTGECDVDTAAQQTFDLIREKYPLESGTPQSREEVLNKLLPPDDENGPVKGEGESTKEYNKRLKAWKASQPTGNGHA